jgi:hypothetical protein
VRRRSLWQALPKASLDWREESQKAEKHSYKAKEEGIAIFLLLESSAPCERRQKGRRA